MTKFFKDNGLTIALVALFLASIIGHWLAGWHFQNEQLTSHGQPSISPIAFLTDAQFISSVFENWESEFLQMFTFIVLTSFLYQRGSAESGDPDAPERAGDSTDKTSEADAPGALHRGAVVRWLYGRSLGIVLLMLFVASFVMHWLFSAKEAAAEAALHGEKALSPAAYLTSAQLWFESFQNWQSEFLSTAVIVVLSIFLRQRGSPESKPVAAPHAQTGG
ncbi:MAG: DUF6766 family protein [Sphingomicrobium sp.]